MTETFEQIDIPRSEWGQFCESFTRQHSGWLVEMQAPHETLPGTLVFHRMHLIAAVETSTLAVALSDSDGQEITHTFPEPTRFELDIENDGSHRALVVETRDGAFSMRFPFTMPMEMLNGIDPDMRSHGE